MFELHPRLRQDCIALGRFPLSRLLLMNDCRYPWFILVPERTGIREIYELGEADQRQLLWESSHVARTLAEAFRADKLNIAAIGNLVPQLHVHHVVRYRGDAVWPAPVWGNGTATAYDDQALSKVEARTLGALGDTFTAYP